MGLKLRDNEIFAMLRQVRRIEKGETVVTRQLNE